MSADWAQIDYFLEGGLSMEYLDFSSVITIIRKYISDAHNMNQLDLMYDLFVSFLSDREVFGFYFW